MLYFHFVRTYVDSSSRTHNDSTPFKYSAVMIKIRNR